jgi:subtilisin
MVVLAENIPINTQGGPHFSDVLPDSAFYPYVETAFNAHIISGYSDGSFRWGADVTRGQFSKIIVIAQHYQIDTSGGPHFTDVPVGSPFYPYIETAFHHTIITGYSDGTFRPGNNATRGQIAAIIQRAVVFP